MTAITVKYSVDSYVLYLCMHCFDVYVDWVSNKGKFFQTNIIFCISPKACKKSIWPVLLLVENFNTGLDLFLFAFSLVFGTEKGWKFVDFSIFPNGLSSCVFFQSIFFTHALVGIFLFGLNKKTVAAEITPTRKWTSKIQGGIPQWRNSTNKPIQSLNFSNPSVL